MSTYVEFEAPAERETRPARPPRVPAEPPRDTLGSGRPRAYAVDCAGCRGAAGRGGHAAVATAARTPSAGWRSRS